MTTTNRTAQQAADQNLADGLTKHASDIVSLVLGTQNMTNADIGARIGARITKSKAVTAARVIYLAAVAADRAQKQEDMQFMDDLKQTLRARFSSDPKTLQGDFGLSERKRTKPAPKTQVAAAAKAKATRAKRGTKGSVQAAAITGGVTGVEITPVVAGPAALEAPAAPVAPAAPAVAPKQ
jgi:hypothetical protein